MPSSKFSYEGLFSSRSQDAPVRKVVHPKYDFVVAYPDPETVPLQGLTEGLKRGLDRDGKDLAYYPHPQGLPELRELVSAKLERDRGFKVTPEQVVITSGSSEANWMIIQALTNPGDTVIAEEFVYTGTLSQIRRAGANVVGTPLDDQGIIPAELEKLIKLLIKQGRRPKYLYTIPEFQNPTGSTLPKQRRDQILEVAHRYKMPILEDDCYVDLRIEGETQPAFRALDDSGLVNYVASFSKILAPGLRQGYFTVSDDVMRRALSFRAGGGPSQFTSYGVAEYLQKYMYPHIDEINDVQRRKRDAMLSALGEYFGGMGAKWSRPEGGLYIWLEMPSEYDMTALQPVCFEAGVGYAAGSNFAPNGNGDNCARLCYGHPSPQYDREGIALLAEVLARQMAGKKARVAPGR
ncbi:MAG: PLP-dependent aminotransferase family protein [Chloroflexi bacterium]|nr:PLP-dependent aminotransferase family protein [Chloroflexota bacterium]